MKLKHFVQMLLVFLIGVFAVSTSSAEGISLARIPHIYEVAIDPASPDHLILATPRGLYRLTPDIRMLPLLDDTHDVTGLVVSDDGKYLLVSGKKQGKPFGVMLSADAGRTWQSQSGSSDDPPAWRLMKVAGPNGHLLAVGKSLMKSTDTGKTWSDFGSMPPASLGLATSRKSAKKLLAATAKGLKSSSDSGKTWQSVALGPDGKPASMVARDGRNRAWAFIVSAGLFVQSKAGAWRQQAAAKVFDGALIHLQGIRSDPKRLIAITQYMKILLSLDGGSTWKPFAKP